MIALLVAQQEAEKAAQEESAAKRWRQDGTQVPAGKEDDNMSTSDPDLDDPRAGDPSATPIVAIPTVLRS